MRCQRCGAVNEERDQFCGHCGSALRGASVAPSYPVGGTNTLQQPDLADWQAPTVAVPRPIPSSRPPNAPGWTERGWQPPPESRYNGLSPTQSASAAVPSKRRRRWPLNLLLFVVIFALLLTAGWILILRPAVHQSVDGEVRQGLQEAIGQIPVNLAQRAQAGVPVPIAEDQINSYISQHTAVLAPITDMNVVLQLGVMVITFQAYGFGSTVRLGLQAQGGKLVATNVEVSGLLWWVESAAELTQRLDDALSQASNNLGRPISSVEIDDGVMQLVFA